MSRDDLDISSIVTGIVTVAIVVGVIVLVALGRPVPEILIVAMSTVLGYVFGRGSGTPATTAHTRALRANTEATRQVATTFENAAPLTATLANTVATNALTAVNAATALREFRRQDEVAENTAAVTKATEATEANTVEISKNTETHEHAL